MSLRREQAELQRALELSSQQAAVLAHISPYTLSSATTADSRDLELRPVAAAAAAPVPVPVQSSTSMSSTAVSHSGPTTPLRTRQSYPLSPDSPRRRLPRNSMVEVVVPRSRRESSRDPLDLLDTQDCVVVGQSPATTAFLPPPLPLPPSSVEHLPASGSSATSASGKRVSARVQKKKEDEEASAAERKRKRAEKRARDAAEKAERQRRIDAGEIDPPEDGRRKKQRATEPKAKATKAPKPSQSTASETSHRPSSQSEPAERPLLVPDSISENSTNPTSTHAAYSQRPRPKSPDVRVASQSSINRAAVPSPTKTSQEAGIRPSSPAQPTTLVPAAATAQAGTPVTSAPATPAPRPLQPARSTPASSGPSTPGPKGYKWKTARNDLNNVLSKFPRARSTGMSKRLKIQSLHTSIGPGKAAPPPPPPKRKRKEESDDDDSDDPDKIKVGSKEWLMMED